jgi:hypothetical protein
VQLAAEAVLLLVGVLPLEGPVERATGEKNHESRADVVASRDASKAPRN